MKARIGHDSHCHWISGSSDEKNIKEKFKTISTEMQTSNWKNETCPAFSYVCQAFLGLSRKMSCTAISSL